DHAQLTGIIGIVGDWVVEPDPGHAVVQAQPELVPNEQLGKHRIVLKSGFPVEDLMGPGKAIVKVHPVFDGPKADLVPTQQNHFVQLLLLEFTVYPGRPWPKGLAVEEVTAPQLGAHQQLALVDHHIGDRPAQKQSLIGQGLQAPPHHFKEPRGPHGDNQSAVKLDDIRDHLGRIDHRYSLTVITSNDPKGPKKHYAVLDRQTLPKLSGNEDTA